MRCCLRLGYKNNLASILLSLVCSLWLKSAAMLWTIPVRGPCSSSQKPVKNWNPHSNNHEEINLANNHVSELRSRSFTSLALANTLTTVWERPWTIWLSWAVPRLLIHRKREIISVCSFKLLSLRIIRCATMDNLHRKILKETGNVL